MLNIVVKGGNDQAKKAPKLRNDQTKILKKKREKGKHCPLLEAHLVKKHFSTTTALKLRMHHTF